MDVPREGAARKRIIRRTVYISIAVAATLLIAFGASRLKPAAPTVERGTLWFGTVKRGPMVRQVRGLGTLAPEEILFVPAVTEGRVERRFLQPGATVKPETVILELSNPQLSLEATDAEWQVKAAEASYTDLKVRLQSAKLDQTAKTAQVQSEFVQAQLKADRDSQLFERGLAPDLTLRLSKASAEELKHRFEVEKKRLDINDEMIEAQLTAQNVTIEKLRAAFQLKKKQVDDLKVKAGTDGVLQTVEVQVGQKVPPGTLLAKVVQPWRLKAELKITETQIKDVALGQLAEVDTRNGVINGRVSRIDPAAINGTVTVDVRLEGVLPPGARPDLSVDGTVELERLNDVLSGMPNVRWWEFEDHRVGFGLTTAAKTDLVKDGLTEFLFSLAPTAISPYGYMNGSEQLFGCRGRRA
ncbi:MAG: HlyD family efflux transporter periplasmic adaptor subunit [Acidobacteria bacterium]|nr:HlyD family efflux transporter periplasmic adaptor subunit [Acidobacteriota bacterium]